MIKRLLSATVLAITSVRLAFARWLLHGAVIDKIRVLDLAIGAASVSWGSPGPADVARWSGTAQPTGAGDLGMDVATGRPRVFVGGSAVNVAVSTDITVTTVFGSNSGMWSDGSDGVVAFDGTNTFAAFATTTGAAPNLTYTLIRDVAATNISISGGIIVNTGGFVVYATGTFSGAGTLQDKGNDASGITAGAQRLSANSGTCGVQMQAGASGRNSTGNGAAGNAGAQALGGSGGAGGSSGLGETGGSGGAATWTTTEYGDRYNIMASWRNYHFFNGAALGAAIIGGGSGGAGGADVTAGTASSGGGGTNGGCCMVYCRLITFTGVVHADGGLGGNATAGTGGSAGGGGGGGGGHARIVTTTSTATTATPCTVRAAGGAKGTPVVSGVDGVNGSSGTAQVFVLA